MKNVIKMEKKGYFCLSNACGQKSLKILRKKTTKELGLDRSRKIKEKKVEKLYEKVMNT